MSAWTLGDHLTREGYNQCEQFELITGIRRYGCYHREPHVYEWCDRWLSTQLGADSVEGQAARERIQAHIGSGANRLLPMTAPDAQNPLRRK